MKSTPDDANFVDALTIASDCQILPQKFCFKKLNFASKMACHVDLEIENAFGRLALLVNRSSELLITIPESLSPGIPTNAADR